MGVDEREASTASENVDGRTGVFVTRRIKDFSLDVRIVGGQSNAVYGPLFARRLGKCAYRPSAIPIVFRELFRYVRVQAKLAGVKKTSVRDVIGWMGGRHTL